MLSVKGGIALVSFMIYLGAINDTYIANVGAVWNLTAGHDRPPGRTLDTPALMHYYYPPVDKLDCIKKSLLMTLLQLLEGFC